MRVPAVTRHVPRREHVHEERHQRDHEQHHHGQAVDVDADAELHVGVLPPRESAIDGGDATLLRREECAPEPADRRLARVVVDALDPLDRRDARQDERRADGRDSELGALAR